ncbi:MAG: bacillithiol system protein YtxJ [Bacteroidia bacterium]|jgi:bacillithiol system protein YtxJ
MLPLLTQTNSMFGLFGKISKRPDFWVDLTSISELDVVAKDSFNQPVVLFKHSTTCSISAMAKARLESNTDEQSPKIYYLDLLSYRDVSNEIASKFKVRHESPQVLLLKDGTVHYHASHGGINMNELVMNAK